MMHTAAPGAAKAREVLKAVDALSDEIDSLVFASDYVAGVMGNSGWRVMSGSGGSACVPPRVMAEFRVALSRELQRLYIERDGLEARIQVAEVS